MISRITGLALLLLLASPAWAGQLTLTWTDNAIDEQGFRVERCKVILPATACTAFAQVATVGLAQASGETVMWANVSLAVGTMYCYRVRAYNAAGTSGYSNEACGTVAAVVAPLSPTDLSVQ